MVFVEWCFFFRVELASALWSTYSGSPCCEYELGLELVKIVVETVQGVLGRMMMMIRCGGLASYLLEWSVFLHHYCSK